MIVFLYSPSHWARVRVRAYGDTMILFLFLS